MEKVKSIPNSGACGKLDCKSMVVRRCAGAAQFSVSEGCASSGLRLGSPRSPEESGVDI